MEDLIRVTGVLGLTSGITLFWLRGKPYFENGVPTLRSYVTAVFLFAWSVFLLCQL